jgi:hypothetical protein
MAVRRLAAPSLQPKSFAFSAANLAWAEKETSKYPEGRQASAVVALLWRAQAQSGGWLPEAAIRYVADFLGMAHIRVLEIATFYTMFNLEPVGRFYVQVCGTTPCMLRGVPQENWRSGPRERRRRVLVDRGGMLGGLCQRTDAANQRGQLRGPHPRNLEPDFR